MSYSLPPDSVYKFTTVETYFDTFKNWDTLPPASSHAIDANNKTITVSFPAQAGPACDLLVEFLTTDTFRVRFNPTKRAADYPANNTRSVVMDTIGDLRTTLQDEEPFTLIDNGGEPGVVQVSTLDANKQPCMSLRLEYSPFRMTASDLSNGAAVQIWSTGQPCLYYARNGDSDHAIIQTVAKPATAQYVGFGEQGGKALSKNTVRLNYFNFDNMRYMQVYGHGPLDGREPLYHSDPFFLEFNGVPAQDSVCGIFIDNPSQILADVGFANSGRYMYGTRFGDLMYYFIFGHKAADVLRRFTSIVGRPRLKPRYILGYHQGCYGYETRGDVEWAVNQYRRFGIPLDGIHIDVDIQHAYQTFSVDEGSFPDPQGMFAELRAQGIKCSTNITPIISNQDAGYATYAQGLQQGYFVTDKRCGADDPASRWYQDFGGGSEYYQYFGDPEKSFDKGGPFVGEVYYGGNRGTTGHYADLGRREVRDWWGRQYQHLFDLGLEMVWQDMTTPAIRDTRGDMKGFPFRLQVTDDFISNAQPTQSSAIKVWNLFSYNLHKATYHGLNNLAGRENKRNFIIGRGSFTGSHRFAGLWTGDNASTWEFLNINVAQVLSLGMCGLAICGEDIGGFEIDQDWQHWADPELLIRWTAAGAFLPWFRNHYIRKGRKYFQEPFKYQDVDVSQVQPPEARYLYGLVLPICKYYIELRYRLLQLFYDAMFENTLTGMPICRAMFLNDPQDKALYNDKLTFLDDQFFVGKDLLLAPLLEPQSAANGYGRREVYLPYGSAGGWYCYMDNKQPLGAAIEGGTTIEQFDASLSGDPGHLGFIVPMYVRAGAILPTLELEQFVGQRNSQGQPHPLTLNIYPGESGSYTLYLDDGESRSSALARPQHTGGDPAARSEYRETHIAHASNGKHRTVTIRRVHDNYTPKFETNFFLGILHDPAEAHGATGPLHTVTIGDAAIPPISAGTPEQAAAILENAPANAWYYNRNINISFIKVFDTPEISVALEYT